MSTTVLIVEDEVAVSELLSFHLGRGGFEVVEARDVDDAWRSLPAADVVVLDWMLPSGSGLSFLRRLRTMSDGARMPVLMLTARASEADRVEGLDAGADDYLVKPFGAAELLARIRALLRRSQPKVRHVLGDLVVDEETAIATVGGEVIELAPREFDLLAFLAANPGRVYGRDELLDRVWGRDFVGTERTVDQHVAQLRARLGSDLIETVRGRGYRMRDGGN